MDEPEKCDLNPCGKPAYCDCQWGSDKIPAQTATLCKEHCDELWERINPLLQLGKAWYRINHPGAIKSEGSSGT